MPEIGVPELLIVAVIVLLLFGPAKAADLGGALGKSIREFRRASTDEGAASAPMIAASASTPGATAAPGEPGAASPQAALKFCTNCGAAAVGEQRFCTSCGAPRGSG